MASGDSGGVCLLESSLRSLSCLFTYTILPLCLPPHMFLLTAHFTSHTPLSILGFSLLLLQFLPLFFPHSNSASVFSPVSPISQFSPPPQFFLWPPALLLFPCLPSMSPPTHPPPSLPLSIFTFICPIPLPPSQIPSHTHLVAPLHDSVHLGK